MARETREIEPERLYSKNLRRLMAKLDMTLQDVVDASGVDARTLGSLLRGTTKPHARTLKKLADGLGVGSDELFQSLFSVGAAFDRDTNPVVAEAVDSSPSIFNQWSQEDFDELYSRVGIGGGLTIDGTIEAANRMNEKRELLRQAALVLESSEQDVLRELIQILYRKVTVSE
ncbi:MAG: helix-turn-helix transcriptional regulator [Planctomycetota bacterium]